MLGKHIVHRLFMRQMLVFFYFIFTDHDKIEIDLKLVIVISHLYDHLLPQTHGILPYFARRTINRNKSVFRFALS